MKLFLDSTYLFPLIELEITEGWTKSRLLKLISKPDYEGYYSDLSIFEIFTKSAKLILNQQIDIEIEDVARGIQTIRYMPTTRSIQWTNYLFEAPIYLELKKHHSDSIDCMIFYLAVMNCDSLATFDETMINHWKNETAIQHWVKTINPNFSIWFKDLLKPVVPFRNLIEQ